MKKEKKLAYKWPEQFQKLVPLALRFIDATHKKDWAKLGKLAEKLNPKMANVYKTMKNETTQINKMLKKYAKTTRKLPKKAPKLSKQVDQPSAG